ncbi:MAG: LacI family DNA-binding transcriptional regulator [Acidimicrobiia bacterium]
MKVNRSSTEPPPRTLEELAKLMGVSRATASNAFNRPDQLSHELRQRILAVAKEVGYAGPDPTARALSRGKRGAIGLVFTEQLSYAFSDPAAVLLLEGLAEACEQAETGLLLLPVSAGNEGSAVRAINGAAVDALALYSLPDRDPAVIAASTRAIPAVTIDQPLVPGVSYVGIDYRVAARTALSFLLGLGHRKVAVLGYRLTPERHQGAITREHQSRAKYYSTRERLIGYREALDELGLGWDVLQFLESASNDAAGGAASGGYLLDGPSRPTAILTDSDQLAIGVLEAAAKAGLAIPDELSVVGMDDVPAASASSPQLTTIRQPLVEKGRRVGEILLNERVRKRNVRLPVELIVRGSTAPPRVDARSRAR